MTVGSQTQIGVYKKISPAQGPSVLVKLAYRGAPSRAEFPLTEEFATHSNNSRVGLTGAPRLIQSVAAHVASGGEYYTCDPSVCAEACLPLLGPAAAVVGIVDVETAKPDFFHGDALAVTLAFAHKAQQLVNELNLSAAQ